MLSEMILMCGIEDLATRSEAWLFLGRTRLRRNAQVKLGMKPFVASSFLPGMPDESPSGPLVPSGMSVACTKSLPS